METSPSLSNPEIVQAVTPDQTVSSTKSSPVPSWVFGVLILLLGVIVGFGLRSFLTGNIISDSVRPEKTALTASESAAVMADQSNLTQVRFLVTPETKRQSFPVVNDGLLRLVSVVAGDLVIQYKDEVLSGSGALGLGENKPQSSPDMTKIALITKTGQLRVVDSEGRLIVDAGSNLKVDYLSGWSTDSQKLAFHVFGSKLSTALFPEGMGSQESIDQKPQFVPGMGVEGFYLLDLAKQNIQYLAPITGTNLLSWVDDRNLLVTVKEPMSNAELPAVFDTETYQANAGDYKDLFKDWFGPQMSFSTTGQKWAITLHKPAEVNGSESKATIMLADFPARTGVTIAEGRFAFIQGPMISPDGTKVAFRAIDEVNGPNFVQLYANGGVKRLFAGIPLQWIDNNSFVYAVFNPDYASNLSMAQKYFKYDLATGQSTDLLAVTTTP